MQRAACWGVAPTAAVASTHSASHQVALASHQVVLADNRLVVALTSSAVVVACGRVVEAWRGEGVEGLAVAVMGLVSGRAPFATRRALR